MDRLFDLLLGPLKPARSFDPLRLFPVERGQPALQGRNLSGKSGEKPSYDRATAPAPVQKIWDRPCIPERAGDRPRRLGNCRGWPLYPRAVGMVNGRELSPKSTPRLRGLAPSLEHAGLRRSDPSVDPRSRAGRLGPWLGRANSDPSPVAPRLGFRVQAEGPLAGAQIRLKVAINSSEIEAYLRSPSAALILLAPALVSHQPEFNIHPI
jgi:hypothetical protein